MARSCRYRLTQTSQPSSDIENPGNTARAPAWHHSVSVGGVLSLVVPARRKDARGSNYPVELTDDDQYHDTCHLRTLLTPF